MGRLIDGAWHEQWYDTAANAGRFERSSSRFRNWVTPDGAAGPDGEGGFPAEPGRYHLYVSLACPWAHRTLIVRRLKALEPMIGVSVVHWLMAEHGWTFQDGPGVVPDPEFGAERLYQLYQHADPTYSGRVTVPVLWDRQRRTIVSNESADIIRMFNSAFDVDFDHIKRHYYQSHDMINPTGIVPLGPVQDLATAHGRGHLPAPA